ncbi:MAG: molybdopterin molybdotransferase MoeA [Burkholderiales bacterium]|jgi:molybdopterin molybdotransferase|nr:molybdopterin molybdotransferase MoeA [Burkholderiales bacterium]
MTAPTTPRDLALDADYDPNSMPVDRAREYIRQFLAPVAAVEHLHIREALGRVLAEDVHATLAVPAHDNSAMDGYAVRCADLAADADTPLTLVGTAFAGRPFTGAVGPGQAVRIFTGGVMPADCDAVVMQERATAHPGGVTIGPGVRRGQNVRLAGEDLKPGQVVFERGQLVRAAELGMLASLGIIEVAVWRKLRVAFFSTGDELVSLGGTPGPGQIYDSNRYTLRGMLASTPSVECIDMGVIRDTPEAVEAAFVSAAGAADAVITSGGVSVGDADYVKQLLDRLGDVLFWKLAIKPGRPLAFGKIGAAHFFGLPGNPVAAMVTYYQFVREALLILSGRTRATAMPTFKAVLSAPVRKLPGRTEFQRGILERAVDGSWTVRSTGDQGSGILSSMSRADCFIVLPQDSGNQDAGSVVDVQPFDGVL